MIPGYYSLISSNSSIGVSATANFGRYARQRSKPYHAGWPQNKPSLLLSSPTCRLVGVCHAIFVESGAAISRHISTTKPQHRKMPSARQVDTIGAHFMGIGTNRAGSAASRSVVGLSHHPARASHIEVRMARTIIAASFTQQSSIPAMNSGQTYQGHFDY